MALVEGVVGADGAYNVAIKEGKIVISGLLDTKGVDVNLSIALESDYFLDKLAELIPGEVDNAILTVFKGALKAMG